VYNINIPFKWTYRDIVVSEEELDNLRRYGLTKDYLYDVSERKVIITRMGSITHFKDKYMLSKITFMEVG
jgi:hypothetical protein